MSVSPLTSYLRSTQAVRKRCQQLLNRAEENQLSHFSYHPETWEHVVSYVIEVIRENYPTLDIPYHSRWRHFDVGKVDRLNELEAYFQNCDSLEKGRTLYDLVITSVLLDAGAGPDWSYREEETQASYARSEGLAVASFRMFQQGAFSSDSSQPLQADHSGLKSFSQETLKQYFQVNESNPLLGVEGRTNLIHQLGEAISQNSKIFGNSPRLGNLFDYLVSQATQEQTLSAVTVFDAVIEGLSHIWPGRLSRDKVNLGDCWKYSPLEHDEAGGLIPFHKLSQWLSYSLMEPLEDYGIRITDLDLLTGLAEYRNGGLFLDLGLIQLKDSKEQKTPHAPESLLIIEWRALTVALLDQLAHKVQKNLGLNAENFPLAKVLQGGTWEAGRKIAKTKRDGGGPPIQLLSDGTVF